MKKKIRNRNSKNELLFRPVDTLWGRRFMEILRSFPLRSALAAFLFYALVVLFLGPSLGISSNYFVIFPVFALAFGLGFWGGLISGILALPANLLLFWVIGHPEFSPESKIIAEISGIIVGSAAGYVSDYFYRFQQELQQRQAVEEKLRSALKEKEVLLQEVHHRVKNNLMMITSLARLHTRRVKDDSFRKECDSFVQRIHSISLVHDLLYPTTVGDKIEFGEYISKITDTLITFYPIDGLKHSIDIEENCSVMSIDNAIPVGMIINELITNALKHAYHSQSSPRLNISLHLKEDTENCAELIIEDNGSGWRDTTQGLGSKLIPLLSNQIKGCFMKESNNDAGTGTVCRLIFPVNPDLSCECGA